MVQPTLPRHFRALLRAVLPSDPVGAGIINEVGEEFIRDCLTDGERVARARYRRRALEIATYSVWDRVRGRIWARDHIGARMKISKPIDHSDATARLDRVVEWLRSVSADFRLAFRSMLKRPGFTAVLAVTVAVGIGVNVSIFTLANEILLRPLPIGDQAQVVDVYIETSTQNSFGGFSYPDYLNYREKGDVLAGLAAYHGSTLRLGRDGRGQRVVTTFVSGNYFDVLQVRPSLGRAFLPEENVPGAPTPVAMVSHGFWQRVLGGRVDALGSPLTLNGEPVVVVGILPEGFAGTFIGFPSEIWVPLPLAESMVTGFDFSDIEQEHLEFIGRLQPGVSVATAHASLNTLAANLDLETPIEGRRRGVGVSQTTGVDHSLRRGITGFLGLLLAVTSIVLLIVCFNVGNMLMGQAEARRKEMATRLALGARQSRLVRQLLAETLAVFALGGAGALFVSRWGLDAASRLIAASQVPLGFDLSTDWRVWLFAFGLTFGAACIAVLIPARNAFTSNAAAVLRTTGGMERSRANMSKLFVVTQVMGAVVLTTAAGLFLRSVQKGATVDPGFEADSVIVATLTLQDGRDVDERRSSFLRAIQNRLNAEPSLDAVAVAASPPVGVARRTVEIQLPGLNPPPNESGWHVEGKNVGENYFSTLDISILSGRAFDLQDRLDGRPVAIVTAAMARQFWADEDPVGRSVTLKGTELTVVGVAQDSRYLLQEAIPGAMMYLPMPTAYPDRVALLVRTNGDPGAVLTLVSETVSSSDPSLPPPTVRTLRDFMNQSLLPQRVAASVISFLSAFGLIIASLGIYGVLAQFVALRRKEIAIRMAVGGRTTTVMGMVVGAGFRLVFTGLALGVLVSLGLLPLLRSFLVGVEPTDPLTFAAVSAIVAVVALAACLIPTRRAISVEPAQVLRMD